MSGLTHSQMSRRGGQAKSAAKAEANRAKAAQFWADVRAGAQPAPKRRKKRKTRKPNAPHQVSTRSGNNLSVSVEGAEWKWSNSIR